jgi:tetratricopeptide (TPR) repeat protein
MVQEVLGAGVPEATIEIIIRRAGGNAFFLEELIRALAQGRDTALPETLVAMMNIRLEALNPDARRVLRAASVFGEMFWSGGLGDMLRDFASEEAIESWLGILVDEELIEQHRESRFRGEVEYGFRHALLREAAYATLVPRDLVIAHRAAALWLERVGESDALIKAEHFERGGKPERAVALYRHAAEQALEGGDLEAAMARATRGISCGAGGIEFGVLRCVQGEVHALRGENVEAERCGTDGLAHTPRGSASWCWAASATFVLRIQLGDIAGAHDIVHELGASDPEEGAELAYVRACAQATPLLSCAGMHDLARSFLERIEGTAVPSGQPAHAFIGWARFARCHVVAFEGKPWAQLCSAMEGEQSFAAARSNLGAALMGVFRGAALFALGQYESALVELGKAVSKTERVGAELYAALAHLYEGAVVARLGEIARGRSITEAAVTSFYRQGNPIYFGIARMFLAHVLDLAGELEAAEREVSEAALVLESVPALRCTCLGVQGAVMLRRGHTEAAAAILEDAHAILVSVGSMAEGESMLRLLYAEALAAIGRSADAKRALATAYERLMQRAALIEDDEARTTFLTRIPENARTVQLARG